MIDQRINYIYVINGIWILKIPDTCKRYVGFQYVFCDHQGTKYMGLGSLKVRLPKHSP